MGDCGRKNKLLMRYHEINLTKSKGSLNGTNYVSNMLYISIYLNDLRRSYEDNNDT